MALFDHPAARAALQQNPALSANLIDETLRYWSPVNLVFQTATQPIDLHGVQIPEGAYVLAYIASANRDERRFPDPDNFDLQRDSHGHLSFAHGAHYCPGAALGKRLASIAIETVLARLPQIRRLEPTTQWLPSLWVRGAKILRVAY